MLKNYKFIDIHDYRKLKYIQQGGSSSVFCIQEKSTGKLYAAKIFRDIYESEGKELMIEQIKNEVSIYSRLQHPLIAKYYGISPCDFDDEPYPCLILEYFPNESLHCIIHERNNEKYSKWSSTKLLINLYGIASGVAYLHSQNIIYRDLKPGNILEDENLYPKLTDFGLSKFFTKSYETHTKQTGTYLYMAPEVINDQKHYSPAVDVFSYGMLAYELFTGRYPFIKNAFDEFDFWNAIIRGERPEFTEQIPKCYKELIMKCWSQNPDERPRFNEIVKMLEEDCEFITAINADEKEFYYYMKIVSGENEYPTQETSEEISEMIEENEKPLSISVRSIDLSQFVRKEFIGEGSFGAVYEAEDKNTNEIYAVKISKAEIYESLKNEAETVNFIREVTILSKINHPGIIKFIGFSPVNFKNSPKPVIITELLKNGTLANVIELERSGVSTKLWNETKKLITIYGIASSMAYLHSLNILHRDLKPANILVDDYLFPKLADFGLSKDESCKLIECQKKERTRLLGTPIYISPEVYEFLRYSKEGDVYAFGLIVYEIMTTKIPFEGQQRYQLMFNVVHGERPEFDNLIPKCYKNLIESCWQKEPNKRPTFNEILYRLKNDSSFITSFVDKDEFLDYVDMIENNDNHKRTKNIKSYVKQENEYKNISNGKGFIDINDYEKQKKNGKNEFWKFYTVSNKSTGTIYSMKMSIFSIPKFTQNEINNIIKEVEVFSSLEHPSLMKFIGYSSINFKKEQKPVIITEFTLKQTLENIIELKRKDIKSIEWNPTKILINIFGIASGMAYLHSKNILHNDLKLCNVYVDQNLYPKLADYGLFTKLQILKSISFQSSSKIKKDPFYTAPEVLNSEKPSKASDVYSFGLLVFEVLSKDKPFCHLKSTKEIFIEFVKNGGRLQFQSSPKEEIPLCFRQMIEACLSTNPQQRPTFDDIISSLKNDPRFLTGVQKKEFFDYVKMIDKKGCEAFSSKIVEN